MKKFLHNKWISIPVIVLLVLILAAGSVLAAFDFFTGSLEVEVEEAIVLGLFDTWDNLEPYGSVDDVTITLGGTLEHPVISIATIEGYAGAGFVAGEYIVIPVNFRNAGDGELNLGAALGDNTGGFAVHYLWTVNDGAGGNIETGPEGQQLCYDFIPSGTWNPLGGWNGTIAGNGGMSGSAVIGAQVLFVKITAPGDIIAPTPDGEPYTLTITFNRY